MTPEEKWFRRLERCIDAMPENVEIAVQDGSISLLLAGTIQEQINQYGHIDRFDEEALDLLIHKRIIACSESL